jgi:hypothetical protein
MAKTRQGVEYLGYRVYPSHLHVCSRSVITLRARLDFFKHRFWPDRFPVCQKPARGTWQRLLESGELTPPLHPEWTLLKRMEATINSYSGVLGHAESVKLRKSLYHKHFGPLRSFFYPTDAKYSSVGVVRRFLYQ